MIRTLLLLLVGAGALIGLLAGGVHPHVADVRLPEGGPAMSESQPVQRIPLYVVNDEELIDVATIGRARWEGTTIVVKHDDHLAALAERDRLHAEALLGAFDEGCRATERNYVKGFAAALDAARNAVAALLGKTVPPSDGVTEALAAIDALAAGQAPDPLLIDSHASDCDLIAKRPFAMMRGHVCTCGAGQAPAAEPLDGA